MADYSVAQAKDQLPRLINRALAGEEVVITRHGKPTVELRPREEKKPQWTAEQIRHANEQMKARRDSYGPVSIDSVTLFNLIYEGGEET